MGPTLDHDSLARLREAQGRARAMALELCAELEDGQTEREAARALEESARRSGASGLFHVPLVLFGARTTFAGLRSRLDSLPGTTRLRPGDPVIVDFAPVFEDLSAPADVSVTVTHGGGPAADAVDAGLACLDAVRAALPARVEAGAPARELALETFRSLADAGWTSVQDRYLAGALAHRVYPLGKGGARLSRVRLLGLGLPTTLRLFGSALFASLPGTPPWPFWNDSRRARRAPAHGLWSFEPHIARGDVGVKREELLIFDADGARWLADEGS